MHIYIFIRYFYLDLGAAMFGAHLYVLKFQIEGG